PFPDDEIDLYPHHAFSRKDELGLQGEDGALNEHPAVACGDDRQLVDLKTESVADEGYPAAAESHEMVLEARLLHLLHGPREEVGGVDALLPESLRIRYDLPGHLIGFPEGLVQLAHHVRPGL